MFTFCVCRPPSSLESIEKVCSSIHCQCWLIPELKVTGSLPSLPESEDNRPPPTVPHTTNGLFRVSKSRVFGLWEEPGEKPAEPGRRCKTQTEIPATATKQQQPLRSRVRCQRVAESTLLCSHCVISEAFKDQWPSPAWRGCSGDSENMLTGGRSTRYFHIFTCSL